MQQISENKMGTRPVGGLLVSMAFPIMTAMTIQALYNVVDSIFIARMGEDALAAVSLAFPLQMLMISVALGNAIGVNSLLSRRLGERRYDEASAVARQGLFLAFATWVVFAIVGISSAPRFISLFTEDVRIRSMGSTYLVLCMGGSLGLFGQLVTERIMQGTGDTVHPMFTQVLGAVVNIVLDPILIFGLFGLPRMGVAGAAVATLIGQWTGMTVGYILMVRKTVCLTLHLRGCKPSLKIIKDIYAVGFPAMVMQALGSVMTIGMNSILIAFGSTAVAVFGVYFRLQSFIFMPVFGLSNALISIVGFNYGAKKRRRMEQAVKAAVLIALCVMFGGLVVFQLVPQVLLGWFNASPAMMEHGTAALRIVSLAFPLAAVAIILSSTFQALGAGMLSLAMSATRQLVVLLPCAWLFSRIGQLDQVWYAFLVSEVVSVTMSLLMYRAVYRNRMRPLPVGESA